MLGDGFGADKFVEFSPNAGIMVGPWLYPAILFCCTQLNFIIKQLSHGNILPVAGSEYALDIVAPEQSGLVDSAFISRTGICLSGLFPSYVRGRFSEAPEPKQRSKQLVAEVLVSTRRHQCQHKVGHH